MILLLFRVSYRYTVPQNFQKQFTKLTLKGHLSRKDELTQRLYASLILQDLFCKDYQIHSCLA